MERRCELLRWHLPCPVSLAHLRHGTRVVWHGPSLRFLFPHGVGSASSGGLFLVSLMCRFPWSVQSFQIYHILRNSRLPPLLKRQSIRMYDRSGVFVVKEGLHLWRVNGICSMGRELGVSTCIGTIPGYLICNKELPSSNCVRQAVHQPMQLIRAMRVQRTNRLLTSVKGIEPPSTVNSDSSPHMRCSLHNLRH